MKAIAAIIGKAGMPGLGKVVGCPDLAAAVLVGVKLVKEVMGGDWDADAEGEVFSILNESYEISVDGADGDRITVAVGMVSDE